MGIIFCLIDLVDNEAVLLDVILNTVYEYITG